jgi:AcrR family transcriptional regulator
MQYIHMAHASIRSRSVCNLGRIFARCTHEPGPVRVLARAAAKGLIAICLYDDRMPRLVDHAERRDAFGRAALQVIARDGLGGLTMGTVAKQAGTSVGLVQHYFSSKDELLLFAHRRVASRFDSWLESIKLDGPVGPVVYEALLRLLPLDRERRDDMRVRLAFSAAGANDPRLAEYQAERHNYLRRRLAQAIDRAQNHGEVATDVDSKIAAIILAALVTGLGSQMITDPKRLPPSVAVAALRSHLSSLFVDLTFDDD